VSGANAAEDQARSLVHAWNDGTPWTAADDQVLRDHPELTILQLARRVHRTYWSVEGRRKRLGLVDQHAPREHVLPTDRILCPCGADVGEDHESWCPEA
jgi:hypothetical protein